MQGDVVITAQVYSQLTTFQDNLYTVFSIVLYLYLITVEKQSKLMSV